MSLALAQSTRTIRLSERLSSKLRICSRDAGAEKRSCMDAMAVFARAIM